MNEQSSVNIGDINLCPAVFLAPMAGITDAPFRDIVGGFGAGLVVSEMVASGEMVTKRPSTRRKAEAGLGSVRTSVQIAGREPAVMAECARICEGEGAEIIDINMGCPAKKVVSGASGAALMREPGLALAIIRAVVDAVSVPVTLKMRLGWDETCISAPTLARAAEDAGIRMVTVHGRTRRQFYAGKADWVAIRAVREAVAIPLVANGDILSTSDAREALRLSGADAVMIGRGAQGQPWLLARIAAELSGASTLQVPEGSALLDLILTHHEAMLSFYGTTLGIRVARKHLGWYLDRLEGGAAARADLFRLASPRDVRARLTRHFEETGMERAAA